MADGGLVSCVLPTGEGRERFLPKALDYWSRQTYVHRELVVVEDSPDSGRVQELVAGRDGVAHIHLPPTSLGEKLNLGIEAASGDVIQKWDDDDIYRPRFVETAVRWLETTRGDGRFVLWDSYLIYVALSGELFWTGPGHKAGPSLCFHRELWERQPFRDVARSVDSHWIADHPDYTPVVGHPEELILVRHGANTWTSFRGIHVDTYISEALDPWPIPFERVIDPADLEFYDRLREDLRDSRGLR